MTMRILISKYSEYNLELHMTFVDYHKAFDTVEIWTIIKAFSDQGIEDECIWT